VGEAIRRSGIDRAEIFVTSKLWISDYGYEPALRGSAGSLRRLGVDYVDLYLLHQPMPNDFEATVGAYTALEKVLADGQARAIGVCNHKPEHLENLIGRTDVVPAVNQVEVHPVLQPARVTSGPRSLRDRHPGLVTDRRRVRVPACRPERAEEPAHGPDDVDLATKYGKTPAQVILRWHIQHERCAIPKSVHANRSAENFDVFDFELTTAELATIDALDTGHRGGPEPDLIDTTTYPYRVEN